MNDWDDTVLRCIEIGFRYSDGFGDYIENNVNRPITHEDCPLEILFCEFNKFLRSVGFRRENNYILFEDLTEYEYKKLREYLKQLRKQERN